MTIQFKKFLILLVSFGMSLVIVHFFVQTYSSYVAGNSFGGELTVYVPVMFCLSFLSWYFLLKEWFMAPAVILADGTQQIDSTQNKLSNRAYFTLAEWVTVSLFLFLGPYRHASSLLMIVLIWVAVFGVFIKLLKSNILNQILFWTGL